MSAFRGFLLFALLALSAPCVAKRVALVIGNSSYQHTAPLTNPTADAKLIGESLTAAGFQVTTQLDLGDAAFERALVEFGRTSQGADIALIYYAGHGMEFGGQNWLLPIDAKLEDDLALEVEAISLDRMLAVLGNARNRIVILDACRDNPFRAMRVAGQGRTVGSSGLARVELDRGLISTSDGKPIGTLIAFAAAPGAKAKDGLSGGNSPYAAALAQHLASPGVALSVVFDRVRDAVLAKTSNQQVPWKNDSMGELVLVGTASPHVLAGAPTTTEDIREGIRLHSARQYVEAMGPLERAAKAGNPEAMVWLAYNIGQVGVPEDDARRRQLLLDSAAQGWPEAEMLFAEVLISEKNFAEAQKIARNLQSKPAWQGVADALLLRSQNQGKWPKERELSELLQAYRKAADTGSFYAQSLLLELLYFKDGSPQAKQEGYVLAQNLSIYNEAQALYILGESAWFGRNGATIDKEKALRWFKTAAADGNPKANSALGYIYKFGNGEVKADAKEATRYFEYAAQMGDPESMFNLAHLLLHFSEIKDEKKGLDWLEKAADEGWAEAQNFLGLGYLEGRYGLSINQRKGLELLEKAAEINGEAKANLGEMYLAGDLVPKNVKRGLQLTQEAADAGIARAQNALGVLYSGGGAGLQVNMATAISWYEKAVTLGYPHAQANLAYNLIYGESKNYVRARILLEQAIQNGNVFGIHSLADLYWNGWGVAVDKDRAIQLLKSAATQGDKNAQETLKKIGRPP